MFTNIIDFIVNNSATIALLFFFTVFCIVLISLLIPKQGKKYKDYANIIFKDRNLKKSSKSNSKNDQKKKS